LAFAECRAVTSLLFGLSTIEGVVGTLQPLMNGLVIGALAGVLHGGLSGPAGGRLRLALAALAAVFAGNLVLPSVTDELGSYLADRVDIVLRSRLMSLMSSPVGIGHVEDAAVQDEVTRAGSIGLFTPGGTVWGLSDLWELRLTTVGCFVLVASFRWWLGAGLLLMWLAVEAGARRQYMDTAKLVYRQTQDLRRSDYIKDAAFSDAVKELRVFGLQAWLLGRFTLHWLDSIREVWKERRRVGQFIWWVVPVAFVGTALGLYVVVDAAAAGDIGIGRVATLVGAVLGMRAIVNYGLHRTRTEYGATAYQPLLDLPERVERFALAAAPSAGTSAGAVGSAGAPSGRVEDGEALAIGFDDVWFRYPGLERDVFKGLTLEIPAGGSFALVGLNGAGKTTLMKLLIRAYEPTSGRITVNGVALAELDPGWWRRQVAAIFQDFVHYPLSARDNVTFGAVAHAADDASLASVAEKAGLSEIVDRLPSGWDTPLSRLFAGGAELSGGQWQRIALARSLFAVHHGAKLLVLDEPTAALDVRAEASLFDRYLDLTRGTTSILISHRFSTVRRAERICVLDAGRVLELGGHDELVAAGGRYADLFGLQAARFADDAAGEPADA